LNPHGRTKQNPKTTIKRREQKNKLVLIDAERRIIAKS